MSYYHLSQQFCHSSYVQEFVVSNGLRGDCEGRDFEHLPAVAVTNAFEFSLCMPSNAGAHQLAQENGQAETRAEFRHKPE